MHSEIELTIYSIKYLGFFFHVNQETKFFMFFS